MQIAYRTKDKMYQPIKYSFSLLMLVLRTSAEVSVPSIPRTLIPPQGLSRNNVQKMMRQLTLAATFISYNTLDLVLLCNIVGK